jgi:hypothetical protein
MLVLFDCSDFRNRSRFSPGTLCPCGITQCTSLPGKDTLSEGTPITAKPVVVIMNRATASAAEMLIGAQAWQADRGRQEKDPEHSRVVPIRSVWARHIPAIQEATDVCVPRVFVIRNRTQYLLNKSFS